MSNVRHTLDEHATHETRIRKSRFLAHAAPVADESSALAFLESVADHAANHNCWAWRLGQNYRFNDDGEPGGSAGQPILRAIDGQAMDRVMVVVTRWFGGVKLGIGGLMRAYGGTAAACLRDAPHSEIVDMTAVSFVLGYAEREALRARTRQWRTIVRHEDFGAQGVQVTMDVASRSVADLERLLADLSRGRCRLVRL